MDHESASQVEPVIGHHGFTPGPWRAEVGQPGSGPWDRTTIAFGNDCNVIAMINRHWPESEANARLIAAAPDMLAALQWAMSQIRAPVRRIKGQNEHYCDAYELAQAAIAKATMTAPQPAKDGGLT